MPPWAAMFKGRKVTDPVVQGTGASQYHGNTGNIQDNKVIYLPFVFWGHLIAPEANLVPLNYIYKLFLDRSELRKYTSDMLSCLDIHNLSSLDLIKRILWWTVYNVIWEIISYIFIVQWPNGFSSRDLGVLVYNFIFMFQTSSCTVIALGPQKGLML